MKRLLIANRGEIALRIIRTAKRMGIYCIALYSDADRDAAHVAAADEAFHVGPAAARESYLRIDAVIEAAQRGHADAIHPGYGFLSENADFAERCETEGVIFIGPPVAAIRAMGSKSAAKALMEQAGVPLVPGYHGEDQSDAALSAAAARLGFPLLIKASAGGGGKGMKIVRDQEGFKEALASAQREAMAGFGDARVLLERYLAKPRHVEMQIFGDRHGTILHLFDRDCSVQRRYQKVVEEAPAPFLGEELRTRMAAAAIAAGRAVGYVGAGTVEFILEQDQFHFMEMNTRLQVEHPVTELITGIDLVDWQIRVARGEALPLAQSDIHARGHAIEVRLYAEDPARDFLPQTGRISHLAWPQAVRIDSGVREGDEISRFYDPMIAKIATHGENRQQAIDRMARGLAETEIAGLVTNRPFLQAIISHPAFAAGDIDTGFIPNHLADWPAGDGADDTLLAVAGFCVLRRAEQALRDSADPSDRHSPWGALPGWRLNGAASVVLSLGAHRLVAHYEGAQIRLDLPDRSVTMSGSGERITLDGRQFPVRAIFTAGSVTVFADGREQSFALPDPDRADGKQAAIGRLLAPMPGQVTKLFVAEGEIVEKGAPLIVIEAMKMEHLITAPAAGKIGKLPYAVGDIVAEAAELLGFEPL